MPPQLKPQQHRILKVLLEHNYHLTTTQVSEMANISWNTADKYLEEFFKIGWIDKRQKGNRVYWRANR